MAKLNKCSLRTLSSTSTSEYKTLNELLSEVTMGRNETDEENGKGNSIMDNTSL